MLNRWRLTRRLLALLPGLLAPVAATSQPSVEFTRYDAEGHLLEAGRVVDRVLIGVRFQYDADGRRVSREAVGPGGSSAGGGGSESIRFLLDERGPGIVGGRSVAEVRSGGVGTRLLLRGPFAAPAAQLDVWPGTPVGDPVYMGVDGHGSVRADLGAGGAVDPEGVRLWDAYGNRLDPGGVEGMAAGYAGEPWDSVLAAQPLAARDLSPSLGRFLTPDDWEGEDETPGTLHRYRYAMDDPLDRIDPTGHNSLAETLSVEGLTEVLQAGVGHVGTGMRIYRQAEQVMELYESIQLGTQVLEAFLQTSPQGAEAALGRQIRGAFGEVEVSHVMRGFGQAVGIIGGRWGEISQAIAAKAPEIAAEASAAAAPYIPAFSAAAARGEGRLVLFLPTGPGGRAGLHGEGSDTYLEVNRKLMVAAGVSGGRLFGFGLRDTRRGNGFNPQLFRIDYLDGRLANPLHVHYHVLNDRRHATIWKPR